MAKKKSAAKTYEQHWDAANKEAKSKAAATKKAAGKKAPPKPN